MYKPVVCICPTILSNQILSIDTGSRISIKCVIGNFAGLDYCADLSVLMLVLI